MAYMDADTTPKVGFRPYHQTDPFGAAHLSGVKKQLELGEYHLNRPFDPWELYSDVHATAGLHGVGDLGQQHPFKPQAWHLHGLGDAPSDVQVQAVNELESAGQLSADQANAILSGQTTLSDMLGGIDPTDQSSWSGLGDLFRQVNQQLQVLETAVMSNPQLAQQIGRDLIQKRTQYSDLASQYVRYYTLVMGSAPAGLSGLGVIPIAVWVAGAAVFLVTAYLALKAIQAWQGSINVQQTQAGTQQVQAQTQQMNCAALQARLLTAQASGDTITAQTVLSLIQQDCAAPSAQNPTLTWVENNALWLGLGVFAFMFVLPMATGRRR